MASNYGSSAQVLKPRMRLLLPREIIHPTLIPEPEANNSATQVRKPQMRPLLPREIFHCTLISEPASYEHVESDDDDGDTDDDDCDYEVDDSDSSLSPSESDYYDSDDVDDSDSLLSMYAQGSASPKDSNISWTTYEHEHESDSPKSDCFTLPLDDSNSTHYQDHDQDEDYPQIPLSPLRFTSYFDCNLCLKLAQEPVVTSCGHLYCWPCLYTWLNVYSFEKECRVCNSKVSESLITPIYCRKDLSYVPPRPTGLCRLD